jgi:PAS domain S-box-containing protein
MGKFAALSSKSIESVLDSSRDPTVIIDAAGLIRSANGQVSALFGYSPDEIIGHSIEELMPERFRARHVEHRKHYVANPRVRPMGFGLALFGQRRDGTEFPMEISLHPFEDEAGGRLIAAAVRDASGSD